MDGLSRPGLLSAASSRLLFSALEFKLLAVFVRRRGRILSRERLLDEVWRPDSSPTDRVINNHIMNLRRKIEPNPEEPRYLISVRSLGHRFDG